MRSTLYVLCLLATLTLGFAEILQSFSPCEDAQQDACTIHEVRVDPCADGPNGRPCKLRKSHAAAIQFDYTTSFNATSLSQRAYSTGFMDLPLIGMETDGCKSTTCPVVSGQKSPYSFDLVLSSGFPSGSYNVKWRVWNTDEQEKECCFIFKIRLVR